MKNEEVGEMLRSVERAEFGHNSRVVDDFFNLLSASIVCSL